MGGRAGRHDRRRRAGRPGADGRPVARARGPRGEPVVIALGVDPATFREPPSIAVEPWRLAAGSEPWLDRLHFLAWANTYDARAGDPVWWWGVKAARLDDGAVGHARRRRPTSRCPTAARRGSTAGPRSPAPALAPSAVVHSESVDARAAWPSSRRAVAPARRPRRRPAGRGRPPGPGRPGSSRRPVRARPGCSPSGCATSTSTAATSRRPCSPWPTTSRPSWRWSAARRRSGPAVRTLNSLGLWVVAEHRGGSPPVLDEPRRAPAGRRRCCPAGAGRRANTDPIGPYVEALTTVRLGLTDPEIVEALARRRRRAGRDVPGLPRPGWPSAARSTSTSRSTPPSRCCWPTDRSAARCSGRCRHLLVDEFQDLTPAHVLLLRLLSLPALDVFGVGDDDQCIYGHAGADPAFLIDYAELFPGAAPHPLTVNYRCPVEVVDGARTLLGYNHRRVAKQIDAGPDADAHGRRAARRRARPRRRGRRRRSTSLRGWLDEPGVGAVVDRRAGPGQLAAAGARTSRCTRPGCRCRRCCGPRCSSAPACGPPSPTCASPRRREGHGARATSSRSCAARPVACRSGSPNGSSGAHAGRWPRSPAIADQVPDKDAAKVLRLVDDLRVVVDAGRDGTTRRRAGGRARRRRAGGGDEPARPHRRRPGVEPPRRPRRPARRGRPPPRPGRVRAVAALGVPAAVRSRRRHAVDDPPRQGPGVGPRRGVRRRRRHRPPPPGRGRRGGAPRAARGHHPRPPPRRACWPTGRARRPFLAELAGTAPRRAPPRPVTRADATDAEEAGGTDTGSSGSSRSAPADGIEAAAGAGRSRCPAATRAPSRTSTAAPCSCAPPPAAPCGSASASASATRAGGRRSWRPPSCGAPPPRPRPRCGPGAPSGPAPTACRRTSSSTTSTCGASRLARPTNPAELVACDGIGPAKLERYGDEILAVIEQLA